jgi:tetratricopeptide (TPR) repeat protein
MFSWDSFAWDNLSTRIARPGQSREERIAAFDAEARKVAQLLGRSFPITFNSHGKTNAPAPPKSIQTLMSISIDDLRVGVTHRGCVLYARIVSEAMQMNAVMVLIEDHHKDKVTDLAVYGLSDKRLMRKNRFLAIIEPHYKVGQDGTLVIRVDSLEDIKFDVSFEAAEKKQKDTNEPSPLSLPDKECHSTLEERVAEIVFSDPSSGVDRVFQTVTLEGYDANKKQIKALMKKFREMKEQPDGAGTIIHALLSQRRPKDHRVYNDPAILDLRAEGKMAFVNGDYEKAEVSFDKAVALARRNNHSLEGENGECVALWQLIGNLSSARFKLGKFDEALQDAMLSHRCAPLVEIKPILRCAEVMNKLGMKDEVSQLLEDGGNEFHSHRSAFELKKKILEPKQRLCVGPDKEFETIFDALREAQHGAEINVDPGVYKEVLVLTKPVTLRSSKNIAVSNTLAYSSDDEGDDRPEILVKGYCAVSCNAQSTNIPVCIVGFKIACQSTNVDESYHALDVRTGNVVVRNCILTSASGPVVCVQNRPLHMQPVSHFWSPLATSKPSQLIMHSSKICDGAQGGILVTDKSTLSLRQVHVTGHAAGGLELREGGKAFVENSHFSDNGRQGVMVWMSAGRLEAKHCWVHSNAQESGALVSEGEADFYCCEFYGNGAAGVVAQQKGRMYLTQCIVHDNTEGVLIQDTGSAEVKQCEIYGNRANGIFVGYDHVGHARISENHVHSNVSRGILIGNKNPTVLVSGNKEHNNKGLPPHVPLFMRQRHAPSRKHLKRIQKNKNTIKQAMQEQKTTDGFMDLFGRMDISDDFFELSESIATSCLFCGSNPGSANEKFSRCSKCKKAYYCSRECQVGDWPRHKKICIKKGLKYPAFVDHDRSVKDLF